MKKIAIEVMPEEIRMALIKNGRLQEVEYERNDEEYIVNRIYKGIIRNVLPGMKSAFVDLGLERNAYLRLDQSQQKNKLYVGQSILVQVVKEEMQGKAARVTQDISLAGRYMVLLPFSKGIKISKRITDDNLRDELKIMAEQFIDNGCGFIIRTAAVKASLEELAAEMKSLYTTYEHIIKRFNLAKPGSELYRDADFWLRIARDYVTKDVNSIIVNDVQAVNRFKELLKNMSTPPQIELYTSEIPIFEAMGIEEEINGLANSRVPLPSGGELCIERTEALTVIDVNSKSYTGKNEDIDDTALAVNKEAAIEAARQLRLRDIGGIIIIDFIDMHKDSYKQELLNLLKEEVRKDRIKTIVCGITELGLVELTRKRERQGLQEMLTDTCSSCKGSGYILSARTIYLQIIRKLYQLRDMKKLKSDIVLEVHPEVALHFTKANLQKLSSELFKNVEIVEKDGVNREAYAILAV